MTKSSKRSKIEKDFQEQLAEAVEKFGEKFGNDPNVILLGAMFAGFETGMETLVSEDAPLSGFILYFVEGE